MRIISRYIGICILILLHASAFTQEIKIDFDVSGHGTTVLAEEPGRVRICSSIPLFRISVATILQDTFFRLQAEGYTPNYIPGAPELPLLNQLIEYPWNSNPEINIISWREDTVRLSEHGISSKLYPSRLSTSKLSSADSIPLVYTNAGYRNIEYEIKNAVLFKPLGLSRGTGVGMITISPFQYYPEAELLIVLNNLVFEITWPVSAEKSYKSDRISQQSDLFDRSLKTLMYTSPALALPVASEKPIKYVILSDSMFRNCLQPFVQWKTRKGFKVIELYRGLPEVGQSREELRATLKSLYDSASAEDPPPLFLLIAGDVEHIPASQASGQLTDLYYAEYDGNGDYMPELFYGRFSAADTAEMRILVGKTLQHEQYLFPDPSFLNRTVLIAGMDGQYASIYGNGQINYMNRYYFNQEHGNTVHKFLYPASGGLADSIKTLISNGASLVNYTGHGFPDRWDSPRFSKSDIPMLQNADKYPVMIGNGCSTATFNDPECLAEALVRAENKGALAYIGCTNDSYWDEDYYWSVGVGPVTANPSYNDTEPGVFDRLFHENDEALEDFYPSLGQVLYAGNLAVMTGNIERARYYWEIYHLFGDPSLIPYFSVPEPLQALHPSHLHRNTDHLTIITEPYTYGATSYKNQLLEAHYSDETGSLEFNLSQDIQGFDTLSLILSHQNRQPYFADIIILPDSVPYLEFLSHTLHDNPGNNNEQADYGETLGFSLEFANRGTNPSGSLSLKLSSDDPQIEILDSTRNLDPVSALSEYHSPDMFKVLLADSVEDSHTLSFKLEIRDGDKYTWKHYFNVVVHAPDLSMCNYSIDDRRHGNGNGYLDPGERARLNIRIFNQGSSASASVKTTLESLSGNLGIADSSLAAEILPPLSAIDLTFELLADSAIAKGSWLKLPVCISSPPYLRYDTIDLPLGTVFEDFESGSLGIYPWRNDSIVPWEINSETTHEGSFSARTGNCQDFDTSVLSIRVISIVDDSISFYFRVSSEQDFDYFRFLMDGEQIDYWSGEHTWTHFIYPVPAGDHTFRWMYTKDKSLAKGADVAWIDFIEFPEGSFTQHNTGILEILAPKALHPLPPEDSVKVRIRNYGSSPIDSLPLTYVVNDTLVWTDTLFSTLQAFDFLEHTFEQPVHYTLGQTNTIKVYTDYEKDQFRGNDTLSITFREEIITDTGISVVTSPEVTDSVFIVPGHLFIFPNPAPGKFQIKLENAGRGAVIIQVHNSEGKRINHGSINHSGGEFNTLLNLEAYPDGLYFLKVQSGADLHSGILIKLSGL